VLTQYCSSKKNNRESEGKNCSKQKMLLKQEFLGFSDSFKMEEVNSLRWNDFILLFGRERTEG